MTELGGIAASLAGPRLPAHLYVHVPFCRSKCAYCDFFSLPDPDPIDVGRVFDTLGNEVIGWAGAELPGFLETVYIGGGTPSAWAGPVRALLGLVRGAFPMVDAPEVTVEANPDSLDGATARALVDAGATRISVGVQSLDDGVLRMLGRRHSAERALLACEAVAASGAGLAVDLMCGVPGQTITSWAETLERAVSTGAEHISVYPLSIEDGTPMQVAVSTGLAIEPDPDVAADMMLLAEEALERHGLQRYETANYARAGRESAHNSAYWTGRSYIGIGPGAHGMLDGVTARALGAQCEGERDDRMRFSACADIEAWLATCAARAERLTERGTVPEWLDAGEVAREDVMLGMRLARGIPVAQVTAAGLDGVMDALAADGLVEWVGGSWRTTRRGWLLGNDVFGRLWGGE